MKNYNKKQDVYASKTVIGNMTKHSIYSRILSNFNVCILVTALITYLICLYSQRHFITGDTNTQINWWNYILENGLSGIANLNKSPEMGGINGDYTTIWYFIIWIFTKTGIYPHLCIEYCIKSISIICSLVSAVTVYFIIKHFRPEARHMPVLAMLTTLFLPAFLMDVIKTNLPDTVYLMFVLLAFLMFIKNMKPMAWLMLGFGICFKLMAFYLVPFFVYFYLKDFEKYTLLDRLSPIFSLMSVALCSIPNVISGGSWAGGIIEPILSRSSMSMSTYSYSLWQFMPDDIINFKYFSIALVLLVCAAVFFFVHNFVPEINKHEVEYKILLPLFPMVCYFLLPAQHEGYFSMAAIFAFIVWCIEPKKESFFTCISLNLLLFIAYCTVSFRWWLSDGIQQGNSVFYDFKLLAFFFLVIILFSGYQLFKSSIFNKDILC